MAGDSGQVNVAKAELASLQVKVVRARLKRMSCEATSMAQELWAEELWHAADQHIASVTSPDRHQTTNEAVCKEFQKYFRHFLPENPDPVLLSLTPISLTFLASR